jgi:hypothetical protein
MHQLSRVVWFGSEMSPEVSWDEGLVPRAAVFRSEALRK